MSRPTTATQRFKTMACSECGKPMEVGSNTRKRPRHFECGLKVQVEAMKQMAEHSGPHYEKWRSAMQRRFGNG